MSHYESLRVEARRRTLGKCVTQVSEQHAPAHEAPILPAPPEPGAGARVRIDSGTLMQKLLPSHLVEPYLTSQRSVITGFVHRAEDIALPGPAWLLAAADAGGAAGGAGQGGGGLRGRGGGAAAGGPGQDVWVLRWRALEIQAYLAIRPAGVAPGSGATPGWRAGSGSGSGSESESESESGAGSGGAGNWAYELFLAPGPIPVGTEMYRITPAGEEFIARHDGQAWLRPGPVS